MKIETEIIEVLQQIGAIFYCHNIKSLPVEFSYIIEADKLEDQFTELTQLIMYLGDLFADYMTKRKKPHKFDRYYLTILQLFDENSDNKVIVSQRMAS